MNTTVATPSAKKSQLEYNATLIERVTITPQLVIFRIRPDREAFTFTAGQFTVLGLKKRAPRIEEADPEEYDEAKADKMIRRAYSISSGSQEKGYVEFYISMVTSGELTPRLLHLQVGDRLFMGESAKGVFTLEHIPAENHVLLVGTGTGLAPYMSMIRTAALALTDMESRCISVVHGASYSWDLGYRGELQALAQRCIRFRYIPIITKPEIDKDWQGLVGRLNLWLANPQLEELCGFALNPDKTHLFLCGHPGMVKEGVQVLKEKGYQEGSRKQPGNLHAEKYW